MKFKFDMKIFPTRSNIGYDHLLHLVNSPVFNTSFHNMDLGDMSFVLRHS